MCIIDNIIAMLFLYRAKYRALNFSEDAMVHVINLKTM